MTDPRIEILAAELARSRTVGDLDDMPAAAREGLLAACRHDAREFLIMADAADRFCSPYLRRRLRSLDEAKRDLGR